jgi:NitT/TauT family transport system ATP-binding protein
MSSVLSIQGLRYYYLRDGKPEDDVFRNLSLELREGELICIVGPSGCGKTTLLNLIAGFLRPVEGSIRFVHRQSSNLRRIGYIFQDDALLPWRKVLGNILLSLEINGKDRNETGNTKHLILDYLETFNLDTTVLEKYPDQLSAGMRQRVAIIQSLMYDPEILLLDEPFASLDFYTKLRLENEFWSMVHRKRKAAILVTHDIEEAVVMGHRVLVMGNSPAGLVSEFNINFQGAERLPEVLRGDPLFSTYFTQIWEQLRQSIGKGS